MKKFIVKGIDWETDGEIVALPNGAVVECPDEDCIADYLSDEYGFLINSMESIEEV